MQKQKVLVAMSGGVDSSVAALLLKKKGYQVIGAYMKNWSEGSCDASGKSVCTWLEDERDAMKVAAILGIEFHVFDFEKEYRREVFDYMVREYEAGRTPNPDVLCNKYIKFGHFLKEAKQLGCDFVATGHYAKIKHTRKVSKLYAGKDKNKDQSYFLSRLTQDELVHAIFPIGSYKKDKVRAIARRNNIPVAEKKDSQGLCFVGKIDLSEFLKNRIKPKEGNIVDTAGNILGKHEGHMFFTIGQRHGLNLPASEPYFVVERRKDTNEVVVAEDSDSELYKKEIMLSDVIETYPDALAKHVKKTIHARIRYRQPLERAIVMSLQNGRANVVFSKPQRAVAPGQFCVFYKGKEVLGSGVID